MTENMRFQKDTANQRDRMESRDPEQPIEDQENNNGALIDICLYGYVYNIHICCHRN